MPVPIVQVDAFTATPFAGNPAAVCVLPSARPEEWMAQVASEMNLSETAYVVPRDNDSGAYDLRWFTPSTEVALCGHATLASAHVLWEERHLPSATPARFHTKSGVLTCRRADRRIEMDFPASAPEEQQSPPGIAEALGANAIFCGRTRFDLLIELKDEATVRSLAPDHHALRELKVRGIIVTALADPANRERYDFVSRFFAPGSGIDEDPVTGSAHCALAPYWAKKTGRSEMTGYQASARGGIVHVRHEGDRVILGGQAVTVLRGELITE